MALLKDNTTPRPGSEMRAYSRAERTSDLVLHVAALGIALGAVPVLIAVTLLWRRDAASVFGVSIYGLTLIAMLTASLLYNHAGRPHMTALFRRIDMSAIHLKIAGTYTPFALLTGAGSGLLAAVWSAALGAMAITLFRRNVSSGLAVLMCLCTGWAIIFGGWDILGALPRSVVALMLIGGVLYSVGTPFLLAWRLKFHNTIWHGFVVVASVVLYVAVLLCVAAPQVAPSIN